MVRTKKIWVFDFTAKFPQNPEKVDGSVTIKTNSENGIEYAANMALNKVAKQLRKKHSLIQSVITIKENLTYTP